MAKIRAGHRRFPEVVVGNPVERVVEDLFATRCELLVNGSVSGGGCGTPFTSSVTKLLYLLVGAVFCYPQVLVSRCSRRRVLAGCSFGEP